MGVLFRFDVEDFGVCFVELLLLAPPLETLTLGVSETESVDTGAVVILGPAPFSLSLAVGVQEERRELRVNWRTDLERERD